MTDDNSLNSPNYYGCGICAYYEYDTQKIIDHYYTVHVNTVSDTYDTSVKSPLIRPYYYCGKCNYKCVKKSDYAKHCISNKHNKETESKHEYLCHCGKSYRHRQSLYSHKLQCYANPCVNDENKILQPSPSNIDTNSIESDDNKSEVQILSSTILELVKQNNEFKQLLIDQNQKMMDIATNMGNNNTTNSHNNNKFNLNVFLNETCKDAVSLKDFVKSLDLSIDDFVKTGELGFVNGLSSVMIERINSMDLHSRPLHCTDLKRETLYIKDETKWEKDDNKEHLRNAVKRIARKNEDMRPIWYHNAADVDILGSDNCEKFLKYSASALGGCGKDQTKSFEDKIMKNIMKEVTIDKQMTLT